MEVFGITYFRDFMYGLIMGVTSTIPGISFGTVAILLNIYEKFLNSISLVNIKKNLTFLIPLCMGCICGIFAFSWLVTFLLTNYEMITYFCFIGMIIGCVPMIYKRAVSDKIRFRSVALFVAAFVFMLVLAFTSDGSLTNQTLAQLGGITPSLLAWIFFAAFISAMAMIIPGISGSIIMLMLGAYTVAVEAISTFNFVILFVVGTGVILGSLAGIRIVKTALRIDSQGLYCAVLGLIIGSIFIVYPGFSQDITGVIAIILAAISAFAIGIFSKRY